MPTLSRSTVAPRVGPVQYPRSVGVRVDVALGRELGISWQRAHRILYGHPRLVDVVAAAGRAYVAAGDLIGLARLKAAVAQTGVADDRHPTKVLAIAAQEADSRTEVTLAQYQAHPCRETALTHVRALDRQQLTAATFRAALMAEYAL